MTTLALEIHVEETSYETPTQWRLLGAQDKVGHIVELCRRNGLKPTRTLEVGSGDGAILRCLGESGFSPELYGVEISQSGIDITLQQPIPGLVSCQQFDGYRLPFADGFFDLVVLSHVLEHVEYERALLREIQRVSRHQVIEIPMEFFNLKNETFHLLGPSYGHINAHTPDSLRFLLTTERFKVLDELLGRYSMEVLEHDCFVNNGIANTPEAVAAFRQKHRENEAAFAALPRPQQESQSSFYAVLSRRESDQEQFDRAMAGIRQCLIDGHVQPARLIFKHYVPQDLVPTCAITLAREFATTRPQVALEFLDMVNAALKNG